MAPALADHCVRCHMPRAPLGDTPLEADGGVVLPQMVDHHIRTGVSDAPLQRKLLAESRGGE